MEMATASHTRVKAYRLEEKLISSIESAAKRLHTSENMYVIQALTKASMFDSLIPAFGRIALGRDAFSAIVSTSNPDSLEVDGFAIGRENYSVVREILESLDRKLTFIQFLVEVLAEQGEWFKVEGNVTENAERITIRHEYNEKWSIFLKSYILGAYDAYAPSLGKLQIDVKGNILKIRFPKNTAF